MSNEPTKREYYDAVRSIAQDIFDHAMEQVDDGEDARVCTRGACNYDEVDVSDLVHEAVDGSQWVIYTHRAMLVVTQYSDNSEEGPDHMGWEDFAHGSTGWSDLFTRGAYFAMHADVSEALHDLINDARD